MHIKKIFQTMFLYSLAFSIIIFLPFPIRAATYYVDATIGYDSNNGLSPESAWKTVAKVNASTFRQGDQILFKRGEIWREQLNVPSSGSPGSPITFGSYGIGDRPIISGANILSNFRALGAAYQLPSIKTEPKQVFYNGTLLIHNNGATASVGINEWDWHSDTLYINIGRDPVGAIIEASTRPYGIYIVNKSHIIIDTISVINTNDTGVSAPSSHNLTISNSRVSFNAEKGITFAAVSGNNFIQDCIINFNGLGASDAYGSGIFAWKDSGSPGNENYIRRNFINNNKNYGIYINSNFYIIEKNEVYNNGNTSEMCAGIELFNGGNDGYARNNIVRYNLVHAQLSGYNDGPGINADDYSSHNDIYYNVIHANDGPGIGVWRSNNINIYNNTTYGNNRNSSGTRNTFAEIAVGASNPGEVSNIQIKNNIAVATAPNTYAIYLDPNTLNMTGLDITNNDWYAAASNWYYSHSSPGNNLSLWNALNGIGTDLNADPLIIAPSIGNFSISEKSPCRDAGIPIGLLMDFDGISINGPPDIGAFEYRTLAKPSNLRIMNR